MQTGKNPDHPAPHSLPGARRPVGAVSRPQLAATAQGWVSLPSRDGSLAGGVLVPWYMPVGATSEAASDWCGDPPWARGAPRGRRPCA